MNASTEHRPVDYKGRTVCSCGDFNCASLDALCPRCSKGKGNVCLPCLAEIGTKLTDPNDELVSVYYTGHGINHGTYRPDVAL